MKIEQITEHLRGVFVSTERYELEVPQLKKIVYGAISVIVLAVMTALVSLVVKQ